DHGRQEDDLTVEGAGGGLVMPCRDGLRALSARARDACPRVIGKGGHDFFFLTSLAAQGRIGLLRPRGAGHRDAWLLLTGGAGWCGGRGLGGRTVRIARLPRRPAAARRHGASRAGRSGSCWLSSSVSSAARLPFRGPCRYLCHRDGAKAPVRSDVRRLRIPGDRSRTPPVQQLFMAALTTPASH